MTKPKIPGTPPRVRLVPPPKETVERYFYALVRAEINGSKTPRQEACDEVGITVGQGTEARRHYADRYFQIRGEGSREMRARVAAEQEDLVVAYTQAERDALALIQTRLSSDSFDDRSLALVVKNLAMNKGTSNTVARQARGEHDVIRVEHSAKDILKSLAALMPNVLTAYVDSDAVEVKALEKKS